MSTSRHIRTSLFLTLLFLFVLPQQSIFAQWTSIGEVDSLTKFNDGILVYTKQELIRITVLSPEVIRVRLSKERKYQPDSSWSVVETKLGSQSFDLKTTDDIVLSTSALRLQIKKNPCRLTFYDLMGNIINQDDPSKGMASSGDEVKVWKTMPQDEFYFGFGEKAGGLQRKWKSMSMWNTDIPGYRPDTDPLYQTIPFFYGIRKGKAYGIFFDNTYYSNFDMGKERQDQYSFGASGGELNYYFIYGPKPKDVLEKFSTLTGKMPLPPKWAIGYQQCRYSYYPEARVREIAETFRKKKIPCDVIYLDIHYMDGYRCFTWDKERFPDPQKMVSDLARDGFKTAVIIDPGIKSEPGYWVYDEGVKGDHFVKYPDGKNFIGKVWPGECVFPDFTKKESRDWWGTLYKGLVDVGIKGFWNDMNEPGIFDVPTKTFDLNVMHDDRGLKTDHRKNHNVYGMQMARGTFEGVQKLRPNERPFVLTRANYAGGNRYTSAWTGDNIGNWEHLEMAVPMCLNLSISGQPFAGTDIGGFIGNPGGELFARWMQLGVFTPLMRAHAEIGSNDREPWMFGKKFESINRKSIKLRYKLLPYIYTQFYLASTTGIPLMRPLGFDYPEDWTASGNDRDFLFGDAFLVAPVLWPDATKRRLHLPEGEWFDYWTGNQYTGPKDIEVDAPIDQIPLFVKAGAIIPTQQPVQYSDEAPIDPLTLEIYPGGQSTAQHYEDDGLSYDYQKGEYSLRTINVTSSDKGVKVELKDPEGTFKPAKRSIVLKLNHTLSMPKGVTLDGREMKNVSEQSFKRSKSGWTYDHGAKIVWVKFADGFTKQVVEVKQ